MTTKNGKPQDIKQDNAEGKTRRARGRLGCIDEEEEPHLERQQICPIVCPR